MQNFSTIAVERLRTTRRRARPPSSTRGILAAPRRHLRRVFALEPRRDDQRRHRQGRRRDPHRQGVAAAGGGPVAGRRTRASDGQRPGALPRDALLCPGPVSRAAPAAQGAGRADRSVLIILDGSDSMNEHAGRRRHAARRRQGRARRADRRGARGRARSACGSTATERQRRVARPGLPRHEPRHAGRRRSTATTFEAQVEALEGKGRTPIGRSLLKAPEDLGSSGDRTVILVSDGGDNCAPAAAVRGRARRSPSAGWSSRSRSSGCRSTTRVRRQLECIAEAGGGTYVDAQRPRGAAATSCWPPSSRAFRGYEPSGTPVQGTPEPRLGAGAGRGAVPRRDPPGRDEALRGRASGRAEAVRLGGGDARRAALDGDGGLRRPPDHAGGRGGLDDGGHSSTTTFLGQYGNVIDARDARASRRRRRGSRATCRPGRWTVAARRSRRATSSRRPIPVELGIQVLDPNEAGRAGDPEPGAARDARRRSRDARAPDAERRRATTTAAARASRS